MLPAAGQCCGKQTEAQLLAIFIEITGSSRQESAPGSGESKKKPASHQHLLLINADYFFSVDVAGTSLLLGLYNKPPLLGTVLRDSTSNAHWWGRATQLLGWKDRY